MVVTLLHLKIIKTKFCRKKKEQRQHKATQSHVETISWFMIVDVSIKAFTFGDQLKIDTDASFKVLNNGGHRILKSECSDSEILRFA
jgi:hypothetical protein